jgi:hypothetical protein
MSQPRRTLEQIFQAQVQTLALTLQPFTVVKYDYVARYFVSYLQSTFPEVHRLTTPSRSPYAGLVSLALRTAPADWQPYS